MANKPKNWLVIGIPKNWETAFDQPVPIWGLKPRYQAEFQALDMGDLLWFYSTSPIIGVIGVGAVKDKYVDNINLVWKEELKRKEVIWPLRFRIHILKALRRSEWRNHRIKINDFGLMWQVGFQLFSDKHAVELLKRAKGVFGVIEEKDLFTGATVIQPSVIGEKQPPLNVPLVEKELTTSHKKLQDQIAEMGKLQFYHTELEYQIELPGERKNLDVVWKREIDGVPTFAFEVELSGMIDKAVDRLKFAFRKWNSRPRIIIPKKFVKKVHNIIGITDDREFSSEFKIYEPVQITDLLKKKQGLKVVEQNLGIY
ncbi:MAG: hypothetical protein ACKKMV_02570 [Candidatus Nealsonbacteria bacterium]